MIVALYDDVLSLFNWKAGVTGVRNQYVQVRSIIDIAVITVVTSNKWIVDANVPTCIWIF